MADKKETTPKEPKVKVEKTPEQKQEAALARQSENLALLILGFKQADEKSKNLILSKLKGKVTQAFLDEQIELGVVTKKVATLIKDNGYVGAVRVAGAGKGKSAARPWRYQIDTPIDGPTGKALIAIEEDLCAFEKKHESNLAIVSKWYLDNEDVSKNFSTYFAKAKPPKEDAEAKK